MAKIWPVYEGERPTIGGPWARLPMSEAIALFELRPSDFVSDSETTPRFGPPDRDLTYVGFKHIVVEVEPDEAKQAKWKPGFYRARVKPKEAFSRLIRQAVVSELGDRNVVRVEYEPTTDSQGRDALRITIVITPGATRRIASGAVLDASVKLNKRLQDMREVRIPIIEYATEAELAQDAGP
jgi:hypothetical protein